MSETSIVTGKVDLEKLLKRTKHHPKGRVQIDDATGEVKNPKNPVIEKDVEVRTLVDGKEVTKLIDRQGGHVLAEGSVWRAGMRWNGKVGAEAYHEMCLQYERQAAMGRTKDDFRPELTEDEKVDYLKWKKGKGIELSEQETKDLAVLAPEKKSK